MATKHSRPLTEEQKEQRNDAALKFATAIAGSTIIFEVLEKTDGIYSRRVNKIAFELAEDFVRRTAS
jgi:hypothetical protein